MANEKENTLDLRERILSGNMKITYAEAVQIALQTRQDGVGSGENACGAKVCCQKCAQKAVKKE
jgi:hypothetical protein